MTGQIPVETYVALGGGEWACLLDAPGNAKVFCSKMIYSMGLYLELTVSEDRTGLRVS